MLETTFHSQKNFLFGRGITKLVGNAIFSGDPYEWC